MLGFKQSLFLLPWLEKYYLALKVATREGKGHDLADVWHWEARSALRWVPNQGSPAARLNSGFLPSCVRQSSPWYILTAAWDGLRISFLVQVWVGGQLLTC